MMNHAGKHVQAKRAKQPRIAAFNSYGIKLQQGMRIGSDRIFVVENILRAYVGKWYE